MEKDNNINKYHIGVDPALPSEDIGSIGVYHGSLLLTSKIRSHGNEKKIREWLIREYKNNQ